MIRSNGNREQAAETRPWAGRTKVMLAAVWFCLSGVCLLPSAFSQDDPVKQVVAKQAELKEKEETLKREEGRIAALRKDVEDRIAEYNGILTRIEAALTKLGAARNVQLDNVVKAYESMPAEDAAVRISALDNDTALVIMMRMKSKKAGAVMAALPPQKAASLTRSMTLVKVEKGN